MKNEKIVGSIAGAIYVDDVDKAGSLLRKHPHLVNSVQGGHPLIQIAACCQNLEIVKLLIELGADVNAEEDYAERMTALDSAIARANVAIVRVLLENGANPNKDRELIGAIGKGDKALMLVKLLEQYGADLHRIFENEMTGEPMNALSTAIDYEQHDVAEYLRSKGCVLPDESSRGETPQAIANEVVAYFTEHFGPVQSRALIEIVPTEPAVAIHVIPASKERNHITLFTTGMSAQPMNVSVGEEEEYQYAELFIQLPADWKYTEIDDPNYGWPVHWLRSNAKYPHQNNTWLGGPVTIIANDDPPQSLAPNVQFTSLLLLAERSFVSSDGRKIQLYRMSPLYTEERRLEISEGIGALMQRFDRHSIPFIVDVNRPNVAIFE